MVGVVGEVVEEGAASAFAVAWVAIESCWRAVSRKRRWSRLTGRRNEKEERREE